jgi:ParB-like chromosome segregation protein Spo0J
MIRGTAIEKRPIESIVVLERRRTPTEERIGEMRASLRENGLLTPIAVRIVEAMVIDGKERCGVPVLVCGATRLAAAKEDGWNEIDTVVVEGDDADFTKAEIIENLHRAELTKLTGGHGARGQELRPAILSPPEINFITGSAIGHRRCGPGVPFPSQNRSPKHVTGRSQKCHEQT